MTPDSNYNRRDGHSHSRCANRRQLALVLAGTLSWWATCGTGIAAEGVDRTALITACKTEAKRGHLAGFLDEKRQHTLRMAAICDEWRTVEAGQREDLLQRCLAEARRGPNMGHRSRPWYQSHIFRLRKICRNLAASE